ncbi:molybdopterin-dependent oxidoreductase [Halodesulfurarchaeum formicicum]|uniref:molybdopterin-dependent oxidoreductase n=1 Tax=Halodesulfurarchaeum formicicum TaxID=1873524 RepID=UPI0008789937|nr:molybdopterin-dependent oxidoreductase [Halodesulfurarchaeum formicicum]
MAVRDVTGLYAEFGADRLPPGQHRTDEFPVFTKGDTPAVDRETLTLEITGAVATERTFDWEAFADLPTETQRQDVHCVTGWSSFDHEFTGVPVPALADRIDIDPAATHVLFHAADGYTTDLPLSAVMRQEVLLAFEHEGSPLEREHGGPLRVVTPHKYAYKGAKWLTGIEFSTEPIRGYWEQRGYSVSADPWAEDRYS